MLALIGLGGAWNNAGAADPSPVILISPFHVVSSEKADMMQQGIDALLSSRLAGSPCPVTLATGMDGPVSNIDQARSLTKSRHGDYLVYGTVVKFGETLTVDGFLYTRASDEISLHFHDIGNGDDALLKHISSFAQQAINRIAQPCYLKNPADSGIKEPAPEKTGGFSSESVWLSPPIKGDIVGMVAGDLDGDRMTDLVIAQPHTLLIQAFDKDKLIVKTEFDTGKRRHIVAVDCADLNQNGYLEIFLSMVEDDDISLNSMILEWDGATWHTLASGLNRVFRAQTGTGSQGPMILSQKNKSLHTMLGGSIQRFISSDDSYSPADTLLVPMNNPSVFSLGLSHDQKGSIHALYDSGRRILIYDQAMELSWESEDIYGGGVNYLAMKDPHDRDLTNRLYLEPRLVFMDLDGDGSDELITIQNKELTNHLFSKFKYFKKGRIVFLKKGDLEWRPVFETENVTGYISDFSLTDSDNDGRPELIYAVVKKKKSLFSDNTGYIAVQKWIYH